MTRERRSERADVFWQEKAACRGLDVRLFFGPDREQPQDRAAREAIAKDICGSCPVRRQCLVYAMQHGLRYGVWGGMTEDERARARRGGIRKVSTI